MALFYFLRYCAYFSTFLLSQDYATYGGVFIVMALLWGLLFERVIPDFYDVLGATINHWDNHNILRC